MMSREITFDVSKIDYIGLEEGLKATIKPKKILVTLVGGTDIVNSISEENIVLSVDLSGLKSGKHEVNLQAECSVPDVDLKCSLERIVVTVEEDPEAVPEENDDTGEDKENVEDEETTEVNENIEE
jgi:YbbR domain-containing protein